MQFVVRGGRPNHVKERWMIKDDDGLIQMSSKSYIEDNPDLFVYLGHVRINSTIFHTYKFIG